LIRNFGAPVFPVAGCFPTCFVRKDAVCPYEIVRKLRAWFHAHGTAGNDYLNEVVDETPVKGARFQYVKS
jgi:hypothetical protein